MNLNDNFMSEKEIFSNTTSETPLSAEFDELCQKCGKLTGKKIAVGNSHGWCANCLVEVKQELEDGKEYFAELRKAREARETEKEKN